MLNIPQRVAIVGLGPSSLNYIQEMDHVGDRKELFDETWTFNTYNSVIQADRIFHMDDVKVQELRAQAGNKRIANMLLAMKRVNVPVYTCFPEPEYPTMVEYPLASVVSKFNSLYFTTTPPYAAAFAGLIGVKEVTFYGCDYTWPGVAGAEGGRACMEYWVGRLQGVGIKVSITPTSSLMNASTQRREDVKLYGYDRVKLSLKNGDTPNHVKLILEPKPLPTAEEIEARYSHTRPGSDIALDPTS